jgi:excisionase family DNA binding protein
MSPAAQLASNAAGGSIPGAGTQQFCTVPAGAQMVFVSTYTLRRWLTDGRLRRYKIGGRTLIKVTELLGLIKEVK